MHIKEYLDNTPMPSMYKREGKNCYYDIFRKKLIEVTPEETVRQKTALMYHQLLGVPIEMIKLEVPISHYIKGSKGRADIVIHAIDKVSKCVYPIAIIECKNESVFLTDKVFEQAENYCDVIEGMYIAVTNGIELENAVYSDETNSYHIIDSLLSYSDMLNDNYEIYTPKAQPHKRFSLAELKNHALIDDYNNSDYWIYGLSSSDNVKELSINLYQCLMDTEHTLPLIKRENYELIEDIGIRYLDYSNAGGGHYLGDYRAFLIKDKYGDSQIISMSLFGTEPNFRGENRRSYCSFVVAIDKFKISHNSLQYNVDSFCRFLNNGKIYFEHSGVISNRKKADVIEYVRKHSTHIAIQSDKIMIGYLQDNSLLYLDDPKVSDLIYNFIEYALLREEMRKKAK